MGQESQMMEYGLLRREASDYGATVNYGSVDYPCSMGVTGFGLALIVGGDSPHAEITIVIRKSVLPPTSNPNSGQTLTVTDNSGKSRDLKITSQGIQDLIYAWELTCNDINQNA